MKHPLFTLALTAEALVGAVPRFLPRLRKWEDA
jgi:hypothetical protein